VGLEFQPVANDFSRFVGSRAAWALGAGTRVMAIRPIRTVLAVVHEIKAAVSLCGNARSCLRLSADVILFRALRVMHLPTENHPRRIRLRNGRVITYRLNRGDIQSIREVLMDEVYRLPFPSHQVDVLVDLGANIGLTSLFYHRTLQVRSIIAVEPDPSNAQLVRENLADLPAVVFEAAVGPHDGTARFSNNRASNLGSLSSHPSGIEVSLMSMDSVLERVPEGAKIIVKLDIEGGEEELLQANTEWLSRVDGLIVEFHPDRVDYLELIRVLQTAGFSYIPAGSRWPGSMDAFQCAANVN